MYLFGFGSLINIKSAQKSFLNRVLKNEDLIPVKVSGYKRVWNAIESVIFDKNIEKVAFLNIKRDEKEDIYGVIIEVTDDEFEVLKKREKNYSCIKIDKSCVKNLKLNDDIFAFMTTNEKNLAKKGDKDVVIAQKYIDILNEALVNYKIEFRENFEKCLKDFDFPIKNGDYKFSDPIQNRASGRE